MNSDEIKYQILLSIERASEITTPGMPIKVFVDDEENYVYRQETKKIPDVLTRLTHEKVLKPLKFDKYLKLHYCFVFEKGENFAKYKLELEKKLFNKRIIFALEKVHINNRIVLELEYDEFSREIAIRDKISGGKHIIKKPNYDSKNMIIFEYLFKNPDEDISKKILIEKVEEVINNPVLGPLDKVGSNLGFTKDLKKLFLATSKNTMKLRKQITKDQLDKSGINISKTFRKK